MRTANGGLIGGTKGRAGVAQEKNVTRSWPDDCPPVPNPRMETWFEADAAEPLFDDPSRTREGSCVTIGCHDSKETFAWVRSSSTHCWVFP